MITLMSSCKQEISKEEVIQKTEKKESLYNEELGKKIAKIEI